MISPAEVILGGLTVSIISGVVGSYISSRSKVGDNICHERRAACIELTNEKLSNMEHMLQEIRDALKKNNIISI